jgi:hypothetical protein
VYDFGMFEALGTIVENLAVPPSPDAVAELSVVADRLRAKLTLAVAELDAQREWAADGDTSLTAWLRRACELSKKDAASTALIARRLRDLPGTTARYEQGGLSTSQVSVITGTITDLTAPLFAEHEAELLGTLAALPPRELTVAMRRWQAAAEDELRHESQRPERSLQLSETWQGRRELSGSFDPFSGKMIETALSMAMTYDGPDDLRSYSERSADALVEICRRFLVEHDEPRRNRNRPSVGVLIDIDELAAGRGRLFDGAVLDRATTKQLLCDCNVHRVLTNGTGVILDFGRETRLVPRGLWSAVVTRDKSCRFGICDRPSNCSEAHHVVPWEVGGPTELANLVLLCSRHHHLVHEPGWDAKLLPDGTFVVTTPTGRHLESRPPPW